MISTLLNYKEIDILSSKGYHFDDHTVLTWVLNQDLEEDIVLKFISHSSVIKTGVDYLNKTNGSGSTALQFCIYLKYLNIYYL